MTEQIPMFDSGWLALLFVLAILILVALAVALPYALRGWKRRRAVVLVNRVYASAEHVYLMGVDRPVDIPAGSRVEVLFYPPTGHA